MILLSDLKVALRPENLIILPAKSAPRYNYPDLYISTHLIDTIRGWKWEEAIQFASEKEFYILTPREFVDFLNLLKSGNQVYDGSGRQISADRISEITDEIFGGGRIHSYELFNTRYKNIDGQIHAVSANGYIDERVQGLDAKSLAPYRSGISPLGAQISLDYWLKNATEDGLPPVETPCGDLRYFAPADGCIPRFRGTHRENTIQCNAPINDTAGNRIRPVLVRASF